MANGQRFFSTTTSDKRSALENAWDDAKDLNNGDLRGQLRANERDSQASWEGGQTVQQSSSNGHAGAYEESGKGAPAPSEITRMWRDLIDRYDAANKLLTFANLYALDPNCPERWPSPLPAAQSSPAPTTDQDIFDWMMAGLVAITESQSDYGSLRISGGNQYF